MFIALQFIDVKKKLFLKHNLRLECYVKFYL